MATSDPRLIERDEFPFEFLSRLAERESWRKEVHRPIYHVHKWWAKRLGSIFRGILLGCISQERDDFTSEFYRNHDSSDLVVFDPFMGSGTTIGEAHKLGMTAVGRDINPVAVESVRTAFGPMDRNLLRDAFDGLAESVGRRVLQLYSTTDHRGRRIDVLYYFWVMQTFCPGCDAAVDLFPSYVVGRHANPELRPETTVVCPGCGDLFPSTRGTKSVECRNCACKFDPTVGPASGAKASCRDCGLTFSIIEAVGRRAGRPQFRLYGKLVLNRNGEKEYLPATDADVEEYHSCSGRLRAEIEAGAIAVPDLLLENGHNTRQAMNYGFANWRDFFNDRHLLALGWIHNEILQLTDENVRKAMLTLFSGVLEFNNLFASYKGEGTGAVRHMFSHHILKPERTPIEANPWGTDKSSGSFFTLFRSRLLRAIEYREAPTEIRGRSGAAKVCSAPFSGIANSELPQSFCSLKRQIYLTCGDSASTELPRGSIDLVVTDPPFFDNVHYSELADFFFAWQRLRSDGNERFPVTTRHAGEVQDGNADRFAAKLMSVFRECHRVLKNDGLLVFSYHHSRDEGWKSLAEAILGSGFVVVNSQPVKAEMSVGTPKQQAKEPIQLDIILVCRKSCQIENASVVRVEHAIQRAHAKLIRLSNEGFKLSRNDRKIVLIGQLLTTLTSPSELNDLTDRIEAEVDQPIVSTPSGAREARQGLLFET